MSQNNNQPYNYNTRYSNDSRQNSNDYRSGQQSTYLYQSGEQPPGTSPTPLLPYHEYMAMKNKPPTTSGQQTTTLRTTPPRTHQQQS